MTTDGPDPATMTSAPDPAAVIEAFGLRGPVTGWEPVGGAWSNRVYRLDTGGPLDTGGRRYAVKEMRNPWAEPRWQEWLAESWSFEQRAIAAGVAAPQPVPNPADGSCLAWVRRFSHASHDSDPGHGSDPDRESDPGHDAPVRVHHWTTGVPASPAPVDVATARWAGQVLAILHGLRITPRDRSLFPVTSTATADRWRPGPRQPSPARWSAPTAGRAATIPGSSRPTWASR